MKPIKNALQSINNATATNGNANGNQNGQPHQPADIEALSAAVKDAIEKEKHKDNPFPLDALPSKLQTIIRHWHAVHRRPVDYHALSILAVASGAIGNAYQVEHVAGTYQPISVWAVIVGPPSSAKSPIMRTCIRPLHTQEKQYRKNLEDDLTQWEIDKAVASQKKEKEPRKPELEQRITSDATIEALIKVMMQAKCWKGILCYKDEFVGLLKSMNAYKQSGQDLEHYLSMWSGIPITLNRSGMEYAGFVESPFLSMLGSIQPGVLSTLTDGGKVANGFLYRLLFAFPEEVKIPLPSGEIPNMKINEEYDTIINRLSKLPADNEARQPITLRMDTPAFKKYDEYKTDIEQNIVNKTEDEDIQSLYGKVTDYTLRIAALLELIEFVAAADQGFLDMLSLADARNIKITKPNVERAITLMEYFTRNSLKILLRSESPVAALPMRQQKLYEKLPLTITTHEAIEIG